MDLSVVPSAVKLVASRFDYAVSPPVELWNNRRVSNSGKSVAGFVWVDYPDWAT